MEQMYEISSVYGSSTSEHHVICEVATYVWMSKSFYKIDLKFSQHTTFGVGDTLSQCVHIQTFHWKQLKL